MKDKLFLQAAKKSDIPTLTAMLKEGFDINYVTEKLGFSALHFAASDLNNAVIEFLLDVKEEYKLNVNIKNVEGITPLSSIVMIACFTKDEEIYNKSLEAIAMLLNAGADCLVKDNKGTTALRCAELMDKRKMIFNLLKANSNTESQQPNISSGDEKEEESYQSNENLLSETRRTPANPQGKKPSFWFANMICEHLPFNLFDSTADAPSSKKFKKD